MTKIPNCRTCRNYPKRCAYITPFTGVWCPGLEYVANNNKAVTEEPMSGIFNFETVAIKDYKEVLDNLSMSHDAVRAQWHDQIKEMPAGKKKIVAAMLYFGVKSTEAIKMLKISKASFYRIFR